LQNLRIDIVRKASNEGYFSSNGELHCALRQSRLGFLTVGNVARDLGGTNDHARFIAQK